MGMIEVKVQGSFGRSNTIRQFYAMEHGHAHAVANAIDFLAGSLLPEAISLDHELANDSQCPLHGFGSGGIRPAKDKK
jgi:hypothetical protein